MQNSPIIISVIGEGQLKSLQAIGKQCFIETFAHLNSESNMKLYLETEFTDAKLLSEIRDPESQFYFAMLENQPVGYLKVNWGKAQTELKDDNGLEMERIYVLKQYHGTGIGEKLLNQAVEIAQANNHYYVWLGVWEENKRAIRFYEKNGFFKFSSHIFKLGDELQTDIMMRLDLKKTN